MPLLTCNQGRESEQTQFRCVSTGKTYLQSPPGVFWLGSRLPAYLTWTPQFTTLSIYIIFVMTSSSLTWGRRVNESNITNGKFNSLYICNEFKQIATFKVIRHFNLNLKTKYKSCLQLTYGMETLTEVIARYFLMT